MDWKSILPAGINIEKLSLAECRAFKDFFAMLTEPVGGPPGYQIFHRFNSHLLFYGLSCLNEKMFPGLNRCWDVLSPHFLTTDYDNEWLVYFWIFCNFPLRKDSNETVLDHFHDLITKKESGYDEQGRANFELYFQQLKASRLGFYQEILSTSKVTKFRELFTGRVVSTVRSVPDYESGEIFLGRIVTYQKDSFLIHDPKNFPGTHKKSLERMIRDKLFYIVESGNDSEDYEKFMRLAGPYLMSVTHDDEGCPIFEPDKYKTWQMD